MMWPVRTLAASMMLATALPQAAEPPDMTTNGLAFALYGELAKPGENLFFSPFSIATALAMAAEGARDETAAQMAVVLGAPSLTAVDGAPPSYDWNPLHDMLGETANRLAPKPAPAALLAELDALRAELTRANATLEQATRYDDA